MSGRTPNWHETQEHPFCCDHNRVFQTQGQLNYHLNSPEHKPRNVYCLTACGRSFIDRSSVVLHSESGGCPSATSTSANSPQVAQSALNQHLLSPRLSYSASSCTFDDAKKLYKCPNSDRQRPFATLSGLVQHAEFGAYGVMQIQG
ncbi:hypothetical protein JCM11641_008309 [Rhodosporidiobolus odoratus]